MYEYLKAHAGFLLISYLGTCKYIPKQEVSKSEANNVHADPPDHIL